MKILLVKCPSLSDHIQPPLGLAYLAAIIRNQHNVTILDMLRHRTNLKSYQKHIKEEKYDLIGFQCYTQEIHSVKKYLTATKAVLPETKTIIGGPHPTLQPKETFAYMGDSLDFIMRGEAEDNFSIFLDVCGSEIPNLKSVPCLVWKEYNKIHVNNGNRNIEDLDSINMPAWDLIQPQKYPPAQHGAFFKKFPIAPIITTRGCPFRCAFCSATLLNGAKIRKRSVKNIINEMNTLYYDYGIREFHITDDNFTVDRPHAIRVLNHIRSLKLDISLAFPNGIKLETVDIELCELMKESGVYLISLGIESGSDRL